MRLVRPADRSLLTGGSTVVLEWSADGIDERSDIEEWEAFLSVDGGRYYGTRITPHLEISIRRFLWIVPNVESADARILIRFGNEREETALELPITMRIEAGTPAVLTVASTSASGESARPGDPGVAMWVEGDRNGGRLISVAASAPSVGRDRLACSDGAQSAALTRALSVTTCEPSDEAVPRRRFAAPRTFPIHSSDILLQSSRLNT